MATQDRNDRGKFTAKGDAMRAVRTIRLTDSTWASLADKADSLDMSKADYLEGLFSGEIDWESDDIESDKNDLDFDLDEVAEILSNALTSKERGNKHLKAAIVEVLEIMGQDLEVE